MPSTSESLPAMHFQVEALKDKRVLHVACGVWHTAANAAEPIGGASLPPSLSELSFQEAEALRHKLSAAYSMLDEVRCTLLKTSLEGDLIICARAVPSALRSCGFVSNH